MFHHKSYCTLFMIACQPQIIYQVLYLYNTTNWLRETESHRRSLGYEPSEILLLHPASLVTVYLYLCKTHYIQLTDTLANATHTYEPTAICFTKVLTLRLHVSQQHLEYYSQPCESTFSRYPPKPLRYLGLLSASPFLWPGSRPVVTCYSTLSIPLTLRAIQVR